MSGWALRLTPPVTPGDVSFDQETNANVKSSSPSHQPGVPLEAAERIGV
jgi:hypothetical protein